jgi:hypothetical protein
MHKGEEARTANKSRALLKFSLVEKTYCNQSRASLKTIHFLSCVIASGAKQRRGIKGEVAKNISF